MERGDVSRYISIFWCLAAVRSNILPDNSRFGEFNSRLGSRESPIGIAAGIRSQALDLAPRFCGREAGLSGKSMKFPVSTGKTGNSAPIAERLVVQPPDNGRAAIS